MTEPTIRALLKSISEPLSGLEDPRLVIQVFQANAVAALALLDNAERDAYGERCRLVPDPEPIVYPICPHCGLAADGPGDGRATTADPGSAATHKEPDVWDCPDGKLAEKNCWDGCKMLGLPPCLSCMESFA